MRVSPSVSTRTTAARLGGDQLGGQLEAAALARVLVAVLEEDRRHPRGAASPAQPQISLWSASGSSAEKAGSFAFSLIWVFQRWATGAVRSAP